MQIDMSISGFSMTGKAWQIRARLRQLSKHPLTLQEFLVRYRNNRSNSFTK